ncbi:uncharacterized protein LOC126840542 isoform X2 [Adelges cooleyi]|uniref:uncharacterized protein LOC126840542 isoform X2 n=1 Tax=Adelges cooleyi TaxID=133065 RepID=UPI00218065E2|nr:uncharacterized protein LOC126840542 isoform X2 [Adelges cooleyi]
MKSNMSLVLFAAYFFGLTISGNSEPDDYLPVSVLNLRNRLHSFNFVKFLTEEQLADKFLVSLDKEYIAVSLEARRLFRDHKYNEGRDLLFYSIKERTIDNPAINTQKVVQDYFGGNLDNVVNQLKDLVQMFLWEVQFAEPSTSAAA